MLGLTVGRPREVLRKRLAQLSCPESSLALTHLDPKDRELVREFLYWYLSIETRGIGHRNVPEKAKMVDTKFSGNFQFVIDFMNQSPTVDMVTALCCDQMSVANAGKLNEIDLDVSPNLATADLKDLRTKIVQAFEKPLGSHKDEYELV